MPGFGGVARRAPVLSKRLLSSASPLRLPIGAPIAGVLLVVWVIVYPHTPDLSAQVYRVDLFSRLGFTVWDSHWYSGHDLPAYSLLFPALGSLLGLRLLAVLSALTSSLLFERILLDSHRPRARVAGGWFAVAAVADVWQGRITFALGVPLALAALLALMHRRHALAVLMGMLCAAASPVAALLLALCGLTLTLHRRSPRALLLLALPAGLLVVALVLLFPEGGFEPFPILSFLPTAGVTVAFLIALPASERLLRLGGVIYLLTCISLLAIHTPVGSNIERYGVLLAGPLLISSHLPHWDRQAGAVPGRRMGVWGGFRGPAAAVALLAAALWLLWGPVRETEAVQGNESTSPAYYLPVERYLDTLPGGPFRVEVPLTRSHWEAALLAPTFSLARGWEKQLDSRYDQVLLSHGLTATSYEDWLHREAVSYVALPDTHLDPSSSREGSLIRQGLPYLEKVFESPHWRIYRVIFATPILSGPGRLTALASDRFTVNAFTTGNLLVRVHYSRYLTVISGQACVGEAQGGWTRVAVREPGPVTVSARFSLTAALGLAGGCRPAA